MKSSPPFQSSDDRRSNDTIFYLKCKPSNSNFIHIGNAFDRCLMRAVYQTFIPKVALQKDQITTYRGGEQWSLFYGPLLILSKYWLASIPLLNSLNFLNLTLKLFDFSVLPKIPSVII